MFYEITIGSLVQVALTSMSWKATRDTFRARLQLPTTLLGQLMHKESCVVSVSRFHYKFFVEKMLNVLQRKLSGALLLLREIYRLSASAWNI